MDPWDLQVSECKYIIVLAIVLSSFNLPNFVRTLTIVWPNSKPYNTSNMPFLTYLVCENSDHFVNQLKPLEHLKYAKKNLGVVLL
jgi:hypothetical protein